MSPQPRATCLRHPGLPVPAWSPRTPPASGPASDLPLGSAGEAESYASEATCPGPTAAPQQPDPSDECPHLRLGPGPSSAAETPLHGSNPARCAPLHRSLPCPNGSPTLTQTRLPALKPWEQGHPQETMAFKHLCVPGQGARLQSCRKQWEEKRRQPITRVFLECQDE